MSALRLGTFGWFQSLLEEIEAAQTDPNFLRISVSLASSPLTQIYLTQKMNMDDVANISLNDVGQEYE